MIRGSNSLKIVGQGCWQVSGIWGDRTCSLLAEHSICNSCPVYLESGKSILSAPHQSLEQDTQLLMAGDEEELVGGDLVVVARIGGDVFAFRAADLSRILNPVEVHALPFSGRFDGLVSIEGEIMLFVRGERLVQQRRDGTALGELFVIVKFEGSSTVFDVDQVLGIERVAPEALQGFSSLFSGGGARWVMGTYRRQQEHVAMVDTRALLGSIEEAEL